MTNIELSALVAWARTMPRSTMTAGGNGGGGDLARAVANMDAAMLAQAPAAIVALADRVKALEAVVEAAREALKGEGDE